MHHYLGKNTVISNINYSAIVDKARASGATHVNFERPNELSSLAGNISAAQDTVTLSNSALALMSGKSVEETAPTYIRPQTAASLLLENKQATENEQNTNDNKTASGLKFSEIMQSILDQRLGIDRKQLDEIDAMIKAVGENENLSQEEKDKIIEQLQEMREEIIEESITRREVVKQMDNDPENDNI